MLLLDTTLATPALNLALDEALLLDSEGPESLRFWEPLTPMLVLGRSSRIDTEVEITACQGLGVPVLRRVSGGATIVTGQGCLMYALTLNTESRDIASIDAAHRHVHQRLADALSKLVSSVAVAGTSDLVVDDGAIARKFSGNSLRVVRSRLLYHGTLLYDFDLSLIERLLRTPPRQPDYRAKRPHSEFVTNLRADRSAIQSVLAAAWQASPDVVPDRVAEKARQLAADKYARDDWNLAR